MNGLSRAWLSAVERFDSATGVIGVLGASSKQGPGSGMRSDRIRVGQVTGAIGLRVLLALSCLAGPAAATAAEADLVTAEFEGILVASQEAEITPIVDGWLNHIDFVPGQFVEAGDVLFRFNPTAQLHRNAQAEADLAAAHARVTLAEIEVDRARRLSSRDVVAQARLDAAEAAFEIAKQEVRRLEAALALNEINLEHLSPTAPFSGIMSAPMVELNGWHSPTYQRRIRMATIKQIDPIRVRGYVPFDAYTVTRLAIEPDETLIGRVHLTLILPDGREYSEKGQLVSSGYEFEESTQRLIVWGEFPNPHHFLRPGLKVKIRSEIRADQ